MSDSPSFPENELRRGLKALELGHVDEAIYAFQTAEDLGLADAAEPLARGYRQKGWYRDAERASVRALERTSLLSVRRRAAQNLVSIYGEVGAPRARAEMMAYLEALDSSTLPPVPSPRIERTPTGGYDVPQERNRGLRGSWRRLGWFGRFSVMILSGLIVRGATQGIDWLVHQIR